ncbi:MAG: nucleotide exchange factor GrpE [Candidatus Micrarchaeota archaeon]|nr:nucleotide exchange factor GrpE [Candidatus Micrarchaeota archaeon]
MTHDEEIKIETDAAGEEAKEDKTVPQNGKEPEPPKAAQAKEPEEDMREKFLRLAAEFDNYKKRTRKQVDDAGAMGKANLIREILPVIDEFQLAMLAIQRSQDKELVKGVEMLYSNLMDTLKRSGLSEIKAEGRFDPFRHEIMMVKESPEKEDTILEVVKKGYEFNGMMIRPAAVIVAKPKNDDKK